MNELNDSFWVSKFYQNKDPFAQLTQFLTSVRSQFYNADTWKFQYGQYARSEVFKEQQLFLPALGRIDPLELNSFEEQTSFWLNLYNTLVLHSIAANKIHNSLKAHPDFFHSSKYKVGGFSLSLDDIEHGILRGNAHKFMGLKSLFAGKDSRFMLVPRRTDPRIHFCLYSACYSSAGFDVFFPDKLESQLTEATRGYLNKFVIIRDDGRNLKIPKIFQWYKKDFGSEVKLLEFILKNLEDSNRYLDLLADLNQIKIDYTEFDWRLNIWK